ncbi:MAG: T9SS C-terminal target domain-containing protein, partial [Candidatus Kapaibacterium sp.]
MGYPLLAQSTPPHIEWAKSFGGSGIDQPTSIQPTSDKGFIIAGSSTSDDMDIAGHHGTTDFNDYWIIKLDSNGNLQWQKSLGGTYDDLATSIKQNPDGGYIVAGHSRSTDGDVAGNRNFTGDNCWIVRLNDNGSILWQTTCGGNGNDVANDVEVSADGGFILAGYTYSDDGDIANHRGTTDSADFFVVKLDSSGNIRWRRSYGGSGDDIASSIRQTSDHGYAIAGYSNSVNIDVTGNHGGQDYWIIKIDSLGGLLWEKSFGGSADDNALSFDLTKDHGYILTGFTLSSDNDVTINHGQAD